MYFKLTKIELDLDAKQFKIESKKDNTQLTLFLHNYFGIPEVSSKLTNIQVKYEYYQADEATIEGWYLVHGKKLIVSAQFINDFVKSNLTKTYFDFENVFYLLEKIN